MTSDDIHAATDAASDRAKSSVRAAKDEAAAETSHVMHDAKSAAGRASGAADQAGGMVSDIYGRAKGTVQDLSDKLPDSASEAYRSGQRAYAQGSDTVARRVVKQPIEALLLAGAIGYLVGWATSRS